MQLGESHRDRLESSFQGFFRSAIQSYVRYFPIHKGKERLVSMAWKPLVNRRGGPLISNLEQANVRVACDINHFIQREIFFFGTYEREACKFWIQRARKANTVFDVGANVGIYSLLAAATNPKARVHSFEPTIEVLSSFRQNVTLNHLDNISINWAAVGQDNGTGVLHKCGGVDGTNEGMNFISKGSGSGFESEVTVPLISLKTYCEERDIEQIDLMKIDIEGGEYDAFLGAESLLGRQAIKCILFELSEWAANRSGHSTRDIKRFLVDAGYRLYEVRRGKLSPLGIEGTNNISSAVALSEDSAFTDSGWINN